MLDLPPNIRSGETKKRARQHDTESSDAQASKRVYPLRNRTSSSDALVNVSGTTNVTRPPQPQVNNIEVWF